MAILEETWKLKFLSHLPGQVEFFFLELWHRGNLKKIMMSLIGQRYMYEWSNAKSKIYFWLCSQASPELAEIVTQMITNHGPLVKARPSAAVVGIPFKRQGSLDGGQLPSSLSAQVVNLYFSRTTSIKPLFFTLRFKVEFQSFLGEN